MPTAVATETANEQNAEFWEMICGSGLAKALGATDFSRRSLCVFDTFFMAYYSYVYNWLPVEQLADKDVLEIGLGYGTIGQLIAGARARYSGLDVAAAPVGLMNLRLQEFGLPGEAQQGSILDAPFANESFDYVVSFGCLHHTGDIERAMREVSRILRPGGRLVMMVYYAYSYRMWWKRGFRLFAEVLRDMAGRINYSGDPDERAAYDADEGGAPAPHTVFLSKRQLRRLASRVGLTVERRGTENAAVEPPFQTWSRERLLGTVGKIAGGDLYAVLRKT
jgi:SAM-dependent methyltransferase